MNVFDECKELIERLKVLGLDEEDLETLRDVLDIAEESIRKRSLKRCIAAIEERFESGVDRFAAIGPLS